MLVNAVTTKTLITSIHRFIEAIMESQALQWAEMKVPRYTSYPTAPHFHEGIRHESVAAWLSELPQDGELSLYLHIPYCKEMCWFCGCFTKAVKHYHVVEKYVGLLLKEIALVSNTTQARRVKHIHFGGGSPTILEPDDFTRIMGAIRAQFTIMPCAEIAVEIDPRTVSEAKIAAYAKAGVNRASLGVQDFDDKVQDAIHRHQPYHTVYQAVSWLRNYGIDKLNLDLVYGLPHQSIASVRETTELALTLHPQRVSLFGYAHVPWMKKHQRLIDETALPDTATRQDMFRIASDVMTSRGYDAIGLDHFALHDDALSVAQREGKLHRNFQGYTTDTSEMLIGLGISSIGSLPVGYMQNTSDIHHYQEALENNRLPIVRGIAFTEEDRLRADIIEQLMCNFRVDLAHTCAQHARPLATLAHEIATCQHYAAQGMCALHGHTLSITEAGRTGVRVIASLFDSYLSSGKGKHSVAV
jgi:oxygen-independent coproporphyrinogen-3 oxidase